MNHRNRNENSTNNNRFGGPIFFSRCWDAGWLGVLKGESSGQLILWQEEGSEGGPTLPQPHLGGNER